MRFTSTSNPLIESVLFVAVLAGCAVQPTQVDTPRAKDVVASPVVAKAVADYKALDPDASFTFVGGHVDSFATAAKAQVPDYAMPVLHAAGLSTAAQPVRKFLTPAQGARAARDLDASDRALPYVVETPSPPSQSTGGADAGDARGDGKVPPLDRRTQPALEPDRTVEWARPDRETLAREQRVAVPILVAFLERNAPLFEVDARMLAQLQPTAFQSSPYFRKLAFDQVVAGEKVLYGRTLVHFDRNWNVIGVSRMLVTPDKLALAPASAGASGGIDAPNAERTARGVPPDRTCDAKAPRTVRVERAVDVVRGLRVYDVELATADGDCHWRAIIDAASGRVLNVTDLVDRAFTDAQVNRWRYPNGDLFAPVQMVSTGQYTRNDRRLEHDFFYMMNDHRCEGAAETACGDITSFTTNWCSNAYGTTSGASSIRATRRSDRDFSSYFPGGASETFGETNGYYWARQFAQWLKPSLDAMGVLPGSASDYPRVLMISDACRTGSVHNASFAVTTEDDKGEGTNVIRIAHRNPAGPSNDNAACEGGGCFDNPSNLHHEMNHFFLKRYYDVGSDLDCGGANQLKFIHEGTLGTAVPQAFWHGYYGVGYNPPTNRLYFSDTTVGRVHTSDANRMTIGGFLCVNNTGDPYSAGRVVAQALWEFYHGIKVSGSSQSGTWHPTTDTDFNWIVYWAADLMAASTYKDRYEYANRLMEILDKHTNWSSDGKRDYCEIFGHHGLRDFINAEYCN